MSSLADRILVIDHQKEDRLRLSDYLVAKGYLVQSVSTIQQATLLVDGEPPDLIFADITNNEIKEIPFLERDAFPASLVIVSETKLAGDVVACLRAGAADFILKPVQDYSSVDHVIHRILDKIRLAKLNRRLHKELEEGNKKLSAGIHELRADQKAGLQVQLKMLPEASKEIHGFHFDHQIKPSLYLSGDFLDYFNLDQHRSLFYFADVSGHGASSAFVTVLLKNLTMRLKRNLKRSSSDELSCPDQFLRRVNQELLTTDLGKHVTIFVGIIDKRKRELIYAIGGHFPLPILTNGGKSEYLEGKGMAVGLFPAPTFNVYKKDLPKGFKITVFSDGILEVITGPTLMDKEKLLLDVVSQEQRGIESLFSSLGLDDIDDLPDDIAVLTIGETQNRREVNQ
jgi:sigma-B regulation protein RsbU (phosphoserine phosphatase)